jgi:hypoxanthine phosphoribosyltransferase
MEKLFITAEELLKSSFELGLKIFESGFNPTHVVGIWRGGATVGIAVHEVLDLLGVHTEHFAIRTSSYKGINNQSNEVKIFGLGQVIDAISSDSKVLLVDDIFDTGRSVKVTIEAIKKDAKFSKPCEIRVATVFYKPEKNKTEREPNYFIHKTDAWAVFPHEMVGCTLDEIIEKKPVPERIFKILKGTG